MKQPLYPPPPTTRRETPAGDTASPGEVCRRRRRRPGAMAVWATVLWMGFGSVLGTAASSAQGDPFSSQRHQMIDSQLRKRGIDEPDLLRAMEAVPRHRFVPEPQQLQAYQDVPVEIAPGQTLSQAYVSARMISLLDLDGDEKVLEVGTGSGYDAALLSRMAREVFTIEIDSDLGNRASTTLRELGYRNVHVRVGDGYRGWPDEAPFDAILVTTAPQRLPQPLIDQLKVGGKMVIALGNVLQDLQVITKTADDLEIRKISLVNLTPMTGEVEKKN